MRRLALPLTVLLALAMGGLASAAPHHPAKPATYHANATHHHASACAREKPTALKFTRGDGKTFGTLSWKPARGTPHGTRYRVDRDGKVVGQTRRRSMRVNVKIGQRYVLWVRMFSSNGRPSGCATELKIRTAYRLPSAPALPSASDASGPTVTISWQRSTRGDGRVVGYRVLRNGIVYAQTQGTSMVIRISSNSNYSFTVAAVDSNGRVSAPSARVLVRTGHTPPPAPAGLEGGALSDTSVALSWQPSQPARGSIAGYRVLRDGTPVGQYDATSVQLTNLAPSTTYTFTVVAVDSLGYLSGPSASVSVLTADPTPTSGHVYAFLLASTDQSFQDFEAHYQEIGTVSPTYYDCDANANMTGGNDVLITEWAQARKVQVLPRFDCQRSAVIDSILNNATLRQQWLNNIMAQVNTNGYDGVTLDFEAGYAQDRNLYTSFVTELAGLLHAEGKTLMLCVSGKTADVPNNPRSTFFDYNSLSAQVDIMFVLGWGIHWATSAPGAQDDMTWVRQVVSYIATLPRANKYVLGMQLYAMDWPDGGGSAHPAASYQYADAVNLAASTGITPTYDPTSDALTFSYTDTTGVQHTVWFTDAATEADRISLAQADGLGGVGVWRLGEEDQRLWDDPLITGAW
ncbi:MAG TPA: glycosyl hydrolase family 18 protein [Solirubrobacteraceae bacterium]|nr:glycosyl hydrolase family 18 protein [Solirubrobacteraceae bacterium]